MDAYPAGTVDRFVPFLVVSGLTTEPINHLPPELGLNDCAFLIKSEVPALDTNEACLLAEHLGGIDSRWDQPDETRPFKFRVVTTGRSFLLPPRRAQLPADVYPPDPPESAPVLHSPFSPLSPSSTLYADGIMDASWPIKQQSLVPSFFVCCYSMSSDSEDPLVHDNQIKADIGFMRATLSKSGYRTRLAILLLDGSSSTAADIPDRLEIIRKDTGLDGKTFFYIGQQESRSKLQVAANKLLASLYPHAIDYYRDLGKHVRKKRGRGYAPQPTVPPTLGTSQTLPLQCWHIRYDLKAAILALFRQEPDKAPRFFDQAYEDLLGPDVLEIIPNWSPRWNEARLLADIIAIHCLRCNLLCENFAAAARKWRSHRDRIATLVELRGRGRANYGWEAWEARWAMIMAELIEAAVIPGLASPTMTQFISPDKSFLGDRMQPWEMLHHPGYWYQIAARHLVARRDLALAMPEDDRRPPDTSSTARSATNAFSYDSYLCLEPHQELPLSGDGVQHSELILNCLMQARAHFQARKQLRLSAELALACAKELARVKAWEDVVSMTLPLWKDMSFRSEGWWQIVEDLSLTLRAAAVRRNIPDLIVSIDWELLDKRFTRQSNWHYSLSKSLEGMPIGANPSFVIERDVVISFISASFTFRYLEGKAGENMDAQLTLGSNAMVDSEPIMIHKLLIEFDGNLESVSINHSTDEKVDEASISPIVHKLSLRKGATRTEHEDGETYTLGGESFLILKPDQVRVYDMAIPLREQGIAGARSVTLFIKTSTFELRHTILFEDTGTDGVWYEAAPAHRRKIRPNAHTLLVNPRPPKLEIRNPQPSHQFYTNERADISLELFNAEEDGVNAKLEVSLEGEHLRLFRILCRGGLATSEMNSDGTMRLTLSLGAISASSCLPLKLIMDPADTPGQVDVTVKVTYYLQSDPSTPIEQTALFQVSVVHAFETSFELLPRVHPQPWPSLFDVPDGLKVSPGDGEVARGIAQKWCLLCHFSSFAAENLTIVDMEARVAALTGGVANIEAGRPAVPSDGFKISPHAPREAQFDLVAQKISLEDRGPLSLDLEFAIKWKRLAMTEGATATAADDDFPVNTMSMLIPSRFVVLGTEPRVLASLAGLEDRSGLVRLDVTIENASGHFLTFGISMEPSDEFGFSGPKQMTLHVLPVSRRSVVYRIIPFVRDQYVRLPLIIKDKYFQKVLRILPTKGMKMDKDGLLIWIPPANSNGGEGAQDKE